MSSAISFSGSSTFATDFQQVITRTIGIASLPQQALQSAVSRLSSEQSTLSGLNANFAALQSAVQSLATAAKGSASAVVSDSTSLTAAVASSALPGTYTIQVDSAGSQTTTLSKPGLNVVTDPAASSLSVSPAYTLTVNGVSTTITPSGNSLLSLANALNISNAGVQATVVNVGSGSSPDYRLSVTSTSLGADNIQLNDGFLNLLDTTTTGTAVQYRVNGSATEVFSNSRKVDLSPGLTVNLLKSGGGPVTITVANNTSGLRGSLSNLVSAYNASVDALNQNRGDKGGALTGNSLVFSLTNILRSFPQYRQSSTSGGVRSLADLGVTLDQAGHLSLDSTVFSNINPALIQNFLGGLDKNGFVKSSTSSLNTVIDVTTGLLPTDLDSVRSRIAKNNAQLTEQQTRIDKLQENLQAQLSKADAVIANLQSQKTYFANLFQAQYGKAGQ